MIIGVKKIVTLKTIKSFNLTKKEIIMFKVDETIKTAVKNILMPINGMLRPFEQGNQEKDVNGNLIEGKGDNAFMKYYERKLSMEKELKLKGCANYLPVMCYLGRAGLTIETEDGVVETEGKLIPADGMQRIGTAYQMGVDTVLQVTIISGARAREMMVSANYHRKPNTAAQFTKLLKYDLATESDLTVEKLSIRYSMSEQSIRRFLEVLTLPEDVQSAVGTKDGIALGTAVALADKIKRLGKGDTATVNALIVAAKEGKDALETKAIEVSKAQQAKKLADRNATPVYIVSGPVYNAERARIVKAQIDNCLTDEPDNDFYRGQNEMWNYIHGVSDKDLREHREAFDKLHKTDK